MEFNFCSSFYSLDINKPRLESSWLRTFSHSVRLADDCFLCCVAAFGLPIVPLVSSRHYFLRKHCLWRNLLRSRFLWKSEKLLESQAQARRVAWRARRTQRPLTTKRTGLQSGGISHPWAWDSDEWSFGFQHCSQAVTLVRVPYFFTGVR